MLREGERRRTVRHDLHEQPVGEEALDRRADLRGDQTMLF